jgi:hypothetical protein
MKTNNPLRPKTYPDISHILVAKAQRRLALAALSWEEKVAIIEQMRRQSPKNMWKPKADSAPQDAGQKT